MKRSLLMMAVAGLLSLAGAANAGSVVLGTTGWTASWNDAVSSQFTIAVQRIGDGTDRVLVKKVATLGPDLVNADGSIDSIDVAFTQTKTDAKQLVVVNSEFITNQTGVTWGGFQMQLIEATQGTSDAAEFDPALTGTFNDTATGGLNIKPFTGGSYSGDKQTLTLSGGAVASGQVWMPGGGGSLGQLVINAYPIRSGQGKVFVLREQPVVPIPLPAAAWTGLSGLLGLGLVGGAKRIRQILSR